RHPAFDLFCVIVVFPLLIVAGLGRSVPDALVSPCEFLGELSYPLYGIHYPIIRVFMFVQGTKAMSGAALALSIVAEVVVCLAASYVAMRYFERPLRKRLLAFAAPIAPVTAPPSELQPQPYRR